ncbi:MAG TPA: DUF4395 domain-containing protein [Chitinophagales bacterium]|nr:DUF4395 domain-containing protein [Chitinophagales bacterium]
MQTSNCLISPARRKKLEAQGFIGYSDKELASRTFGIRFAPALCSLFIATGVTFASIPLLSFVAITALFGVILPYHPFDYLYNATVRHWLNKAPVGPNTPQRRFACGLATLWLAGVIGLFYAHLFMLGYILGAILASVALLVATTDFCIPSAIYNFLFRRTKAIA